VPPDNPTSFGNHTRPHPRRRYHFDSAQSANVRDRGSAKPESRKPSWYGRCGYAKSSAFAGEYHCTDKSYYYRWIRRVGRIIGAALRERSERFLVIETSDPLISDLREANIEVIPGNAAQPDVLKAANLPGAKYVMIAIPEAFEAGQVVQQARAANPKSQIIARAHSDAEVEHLNSLGANTVIMGEREIAREMIEYFSAHETRKPDLA
jgi:monovalent cation:H+ antiporter-2, CPA2 family